MLTFQIRRQLQDLQVSRAFYQYFLVSYFIDQFRRHQSSCLIQDNTSRQLQSHRSILQLRQHSILSGGQKNENQLLNEADVQIQDLQCEINNNAEVDNGVYHKYVYSSDQDGGNNNQQNNSTDHAQEFHKKRKTLNTIDQNVNGSEGKLGQHRKEKQNSMIKRGNLCRQ